MILQVLHADKKTEEEKGKKGRITIRTSDTDMVVICIHFLPQVANTTQF